MKALETTCSMQDFVQERLDVYKAALAFLAILDVYRARQAVSDASIAVRRERLLRSSPC